MEAKESSIAIEGRIGEDRRQSDEGGGLGDPFALGTQLSIYELFGGIHKLYQVVNQGRGNMVGSAAFTLFQVEPVDDGPTHEKKAHAFPILHLESPRGTDVHAGTTPNASG